MTLLTALQRRNGWLGLFSVYPRHPKHGAMLFSRNFFSEKHNDHLPHRKRGMSLPTQRKPALSHPPRQAESETRSGLGPQGAQPRGQEPRRSVSLRGHSPRGPHQLSGPGLSSSDRSSLRGGGSLRKHGNCGMARTPPMSSDPMCACAESHFLSPFRSLLKRLSAGGKGMSSYLAIGKGRPPTAGQTVRRGR